MWTETLLLVTGQVQSADDVIGRTATLVTDVPEQERALLIHVTTAEDAQHAPAYTGVVCQAILVTDDAIKLAPTPLTELRPVEATALRTALVARSWAAWARAPHVVRALLGCPEPLLPLVTAAAQLYMPLATLARAAAADRLPTIRTGDRHMVYLATITEAIARRQLHPQAGRPRRGRQI